MQHKNPHCYIDDLPCNVIHINYELKAALFTSGPFQMSRPFARLHDLHISINDLKSALLQEHALTTESAVKKGYITPEGHRRNYLDSMVEFVMELCSDNTPKLSIKAIRQKLEHFGFNADKASEYLQILEREQKTVEQLISSVRSKQAYERSIPVKSLRNTDSVRQFEHAQPLLS